MRNVFLLRKGTTKIITFLVLRKVMEKHLIQKYVQQNKRNYVQTMKRAKLLNEPQVRKNFLPLPNFLYQSLGIATG